VSKSRAFRFYDTISFQLLSKDGLFSIVICSFDLMRDAPSFFFSFRWPFLLICLAIQWHGVRVFWRVSDQPYLWSKQSRSYVAISHSLKKAAVAPKAPVPHYWGFCVFKLLSTTSLPKGKGAGGPLKLLIIYIFLWKSVYQKVRFYMRFLTKSFRIC
jgi:hypothetical protein